MSDIFFAFRAYNTETRFGYGTKEDAEAFADILNNGLEINVYGIYTLAESEVIENNLTEHDDVLDLREMLESHADGNWV